MIIHSSMSTNCYFEWDVEITMGLVTLAPKSILGMFMGQNRASARSRDCEHAGASCKLLFLCVCVAT